jgi:uncharacterized protein (TIGR02246 family)
MTLISVTVASRPIDRGIIFLLNRAKRRRHAGVAIKRSGMRNIFKDIDGLVFVLAFVSALGCGLIAGIFFAFSNFVMKSLARLPPADGIAAMQAINVDVLNGWFFAAFFGTALCCLVLAVSSFFRWDRPDAIYLLNGSLLYLVGTILVTIIFNVPLNDALAAVDPATAHASDLWNTYVKSWTVWNHVRTGMALAAAASFTVALCHAGSPYDRLRSKTSSPTTRTTLPHEPEDWPRLFEQHFNAGDLDAVMALYELEARFVTQSGETLVGHDAIRRVLGGMIAEKTQFRSRIVRAVTVGDIVQFYTDFEGTTVDSSGNTMPVHSKAIEVLRRQPDGGWKLIMGDPNGRK